MYWRLDKYGGEAGINLRERESGNPNVCGKCNSTLSRRGEAVRGAVREDSTMGLAVYRISKFLLRIPYVVRASEAYSIYLEECGKIKERPATRETYYRRMRRACRFSKEASGDTIAMTHGFEVHLYNEKGKSLNFETELLPKLASLSWRLQLNGEETRISEDKMKLRRLYREDMNKIETSSKDDESWSLSESIKSCPPRIWRCVVMISETTAEERRRASIERRNERYVDYWPWNPSRAPPISQMKDREKFMAQSRFFMIEIAIGFDGKSLGPIRGSLSHVIGRHSSESVLTTLNRLGVTVGRKPVWSSLARILEKEKSSSLVTKFNVNTQRARCILVSTDNLDYRASSAQPIDGKTSREMHMTITQHTESLPFTPRATIKSTGLQGQGTVITKMGRSKDASDGSVRSEKLMFRRKHSTSDKEGHGESRDPTDIVRCTNPGVLRDWEILFWGIVSINKAELKEESSPRSLSSILESLLLGDEKARAKMSYIELRDEAANARGTMENVAEYVRRYARVGELVDYVAIAADQPLYKRLVELTTEGPGGKNPAYQWLIPINGSLHKSMAMQKVVKDLFADDGLRELAIHSGLYERSEANLTNLSHFKKIHRFLIQSLAAVMIYMEGKLDEGINSGESDPEWVVAAEGLKIFEKSKLRLKFSEHSCNVLGVGSRLRSRLIEKAGKYEMWKMLQMMTHCLQTYLAYHHGVRSGHAELSINANLEFMLYFFAAGSLNYQTVSIYECVVRARMPEKVHRKLYEDGFFTINILGSDCHANLGADEALQMCEVRDVKQLCKKK